jgi:chloramphenicol-sensitive protein RarD
MPTSYPAHLVSIPSNQLGSQRTTGVACAIAGYGWWALVTPVYFYWIKSVPALEQLGWRVVAGVPTMLVFLWAMGRLGEVRAALRERRVLGMLAVSAVLIGINWFVFLYSVMTDRLSDASLGYYISPLVAILLGLVVLGERLRRLQWVAVGVAAMGVVAMAVALGKLPWISLALAGSFGLYGLTRKQVDAAPAPGLAVEMLLLFPLMAGGLLLVQFDTGMSAFSDDNFITTLLVLGGVQTMVPLILFTMGAKRLTLSTVGVLQYISPTGQLLLATLAFGEAFSTGQLVAFCFIWIAVILYCTDALLHVRRERRFDISIPGEV